NRNTIAIIPNKNGQGYLHHSSCVNCFPKMSFTGRCIADCTEANLVAFIGKFTELLKNWYVPKYPRSQCESYRSRHLCSGGCHIRCSIFLCCEVQPFPVFIGVGGSIVTIHLPARAKRLAFEAGIGVYLCEKLPGIGQTDCKHKGLVAV